MPAVLRAQRKTGLADDKLVDAAARENVKMVCQRILQDSAPLRNLAEKGKIKVIGAYKMLSSGNVEFF